MFSRIGTPEILILLLIILLLFGPGRIGKVAGELGQSIRNFRDGIASGSKEDENKEPPQEKSK